MTLDFNIILQDKLFGKSHFTKMDLVKVLSAYIDNPKTITWRIHDLKEKGIIHNIRRGLYGWGKKARYVPEVAEQSKAIYNSIQEKFPFTKLCITETRWFNEFMLHQVFQTYLVIEAEKDATNAIFRALKEAGENAFLNPNSEIFETYISVSESPLIIKPLISESPLQWAEKINVPTLEKMLVDIISDSETYGAQETEAPIIFKSVTEKFNINGNKLVRYARRRNRENELKDYYQFSL